MASNPASEDIIIAEATPMSLPSLETIVPRSFHPTNEFHRKVFPNTPSNRAWWSQAFQDEIDSPSCHMLTALDPNATSDLSAVGILCLRLLSHDEANHGFWDLYPLSPDHDASLFVPAMQSMKLLPGEGRERFLLELFGVDHAYKGTGVGKRLLAKACELADEKGVPICVEANHMAVGFYEKFGFLEGREKTKMPDMEYYLHLLVREPRGD